jgi:anti-sigma28 factor (negative regulator of flagellin synthesis)
MPKRSPERKGRKSMETAYEVSTVRMTEEQWAAVRREAMKRATERGSSKVDTSEVLRELVDVWRAKRK